VVEEFGISYIDFGEPFTWEEVQKRLKIEHGFRLPTLGESIMIDFAHVAIWIDQEINGKRMVMDRLWGPQIVKSGAYGLILVEEKDNE